MIRRVIKHFNCSASVNTNTQCGEGRTHLAALTGVVPGCVDALLTARAAGVGWTHTLTGPLVTDVSWLVARLTP